MPNYYTIRTSSNGADSGFVITGAGTINAAMTDNLDSTYIRKPASSSNYYVAQYLQTLSGTVPPSGHYVVSTQGLVRATQGAGGSTTLILFNVTNGGQGQEILAQTTRNGTVALPSTVNISSASRTTGGVLTATTATAHGLAVGDLVLVRNSSTGTPTSFANGSYRVLTVGTTTTFTAQEISATSGFTASTVNATNGVVGIAWNMTTGLITSDGWSVTTGTAAKAPLTTPLLYLADDGTSADRGTFYEWYYEVVTAALPTVTLTGVDGDTSAPFTVTTTSKPTITWSYSQADSYSQKKYRVKVFTSTTATPDTTTTGLVYDSGIVSGATTSNQVTTNLVNGTTYYAYVKASAANAVAKNDDSWSSWSSALTFTVSLPAPTVPSLTATWGATEQRVRLVATGAAVTAPMTDQTFDLQRSDDGGTTWYYVRGGTSKTPNGSYQVTVDDFEMKRNNTAQYRVRSVATGAGNTIASAWSSAVTASVPALTNWVFRSLGSSGELAIAKDVKVRADLDTEQTEDIGVFKPLGRSSTFVVHGTVRGEDGTYNIYCPDQTTFDSITAVVNGRAVILVADPFGKQKYIQVTNRTYKKTGTTNAPRYDVTLAYVESDSGLTAG